MSPGKAREVGLGESSRSGAVSHGATTEGSEDAQDSTGKGS